MQDTNTKAKLLRLSTASGVELVARIVLYGDTFGPAHRYTNESRALVEFRRAGASPTASYVNAFQLDLFETIALDVRFSPDGSLPLALPIAEVQRLVRWLEESGAIRHEGDDDLI